MNKVLLYNHLTIVVQFLKAYLTVATPTAAAKVVAENSTADKINHQTVYRKGMYYLYKGTILGDRRGKHAKTMSFLNDEDIRIKVQDYLLEQKKNQRTTSKLVTFVNELLEERGGDDVRKKISIRTAQRYMHTFGYNFEHYKKAYILTITTRKMSLITEKNIIVQT